MGKGESLMKAVMLAAGVGRRLYGDENDDLPKALLRFEGKTLLERHVGILKALGVDELVLVVGHRKEDLLAEAEKVAPDGFVRSVFNPRFKEGPILSLWTADEELRSGEDVLFMDSDVLYPPELMSRLIRSVHDSCFLIDRDFEPGEEPVKLCIRDGEPVDFGKQVIDDYDDVGEWPGFLKMSGHVAAKIADAARVYIDKGECDVTYEEAMRDVLAAEPEGTFGYEDITGIPWIEIDFPSDLLRAQKIVMPLVGDFVAEQTPSPEQLRINQAPGE
ncbi:MAG: phosphocholine cytidylyltransferase family protein [Proteobacteria bacterium]|nr:phosphocholine cytidylyltransferase family protein [Pseudomonadota bacterium]